MHNTHEIGIGTSIIPVSMKVNMHQWFAFFSIQSTKQAVGEDQILKTGRQL